MKVAFPITIAAAALLVATRLLRPGASTKVAWMALTVPLLTTWFATALTIFAAPAALRLGLILGTTWRVCVFNIVLLSAPTFAAVFWATRGLAPTRLSLAGAGAGLVAGAQAVLAYVLYSVEMTVPFWGVWYVLGMFVPTVVGALLGPRLLRW